MQLSDQEKEEIKGLLDRGEPLPDKYRFLLFKEPHEAELIWPGKTHDVTNVVLPFQSIEQIDEPRAETVDTKADLFTLDRATGRQLDQQADLGRQQARPVLAQERTTAPRDRKCGRTEARLHRPALRHRR